MVVAMKKRFVNAVSDAGRLAVAVTVFLPVFLIWLALTAIRDGVTGAKRR
jgi:hypothetical protein